MFLLAPETRALNFRASAFLRPRAPSPTEADSFPLQPTKQAKQTTSTASNVAGQDYKRLFNGKSLYSLKKKSLTGIIHKMPKLDPRLFQQYDDGVPILEPVRDEASANELLSPFARAVIKTASNNT